MSKNKIGVLLADDHEVLRDALEAFINREPDMEVVASCSSGDAAVQLTLQKRPDVAVIDIKMPGLNGIDATRQIVGKVPTVKVICLSMHKENSLVDAMLRAGASGYLIKNSAGRELINAIRVVISGGTFISPLIAGDIVQCFLENHPKPQDSVFVKLTGKEREVLQMIAEGLCTKEIAARLGISLKAVFARRAHIKEKLDLDSDVELARYALRQGLATL